MKQLTNGIFSSKIYFGSELWIGAPNYLKKKIQTLQLQACRLTLGPVAQIWSTKRLLTEINWDLVNSLLEITSSRLTHSIIYQYKPEVLAHRIKSQSKQNPPDTRITGQGKIGTKPKNVGKTIVTKNHYRANTYEIYSKIPKIITDIKEPQFFLKIN